MLTAKRAHRQEVRKRNETQTKLMANSCTNSSRGMLNQSIICSIRLLENVFFFLGRFGFSSLNLSIISCVCVFSSMFARLRAHVCTAAAFLLVILLFFFLFFLRRCSSLFRFKIFFLFSRRQLNIFFSSSSISFLQRCFCCQFRFWSFTVRFQNADACIDFLLKWNHGKERWQNKWENFEPKKL